jgi:uncharacterized protein
MRVRDLSRGLLKERSCGTMLGWRKANATNMNTPNTPGSEDENLEIIQRHGNDPRQSDVPRSAREDEEQEDRKAPEGHVLITGATSGIGLEIAKLFAERSYPMFIVGHEAERLKDTEALLRGLGASMVHGVEADLMLPGGPLRVRNAVRDALATIEILVNDAGVGEYGRFVETDLERELDLIQLNVGSLVHLTKLFLPSMIQRGHGRILNLASISSYQPTPLLSVYSATKAFVLHFTDSLRHEVQDTGVTVTALIPGPTRTDFFRKAGMEHTVAATNDPEDPAVVAKVGFDALFADEAHGYAPGIRQQAVMSSVMSNQRVAAMAAKQMEPNEEDKK